MSNFAHKKNIAVIEVAMYNCLINDSSMCGHDMRIVVTKALSMPYYSNTTYTELVANLLMDEGGKFEFALGDEFLMTLPETDLGRDLYEFAANMVGSC